MKLTHAVAMVVAGALVAGGSGDSDATGDHSSTSTFLAAAIKRADTTAADTGYRTTMKMDIAEGGEEVHLRAEIDATGDDKRARGDMSLDAGGRKLDMEVLGVDDVVYARGPAFDAALPDGKEWVRLDAGGLADQQLTPKQFIDLLRDTPGVEEVGRETIDGRQTVHVRGPLDFEEAAKRVDGGPFKQLGEQEKEALDRMDATVEVWIDEQDSRLHRMKLAVTYDDKPAASIVSETLEDTGALADVEAPDPSVTVDQSAIVPGE